MAIGLARPEYVTRSKGDNACCKSAYNARSRIVDQKTGQIFNWVKRGGNVFHEVMLPQHVDKKFSDAANFANEVERAENRKDSQLYVEWLLALAKDEDGVDLEFRIETVKEFIKRKGWIEEGLGVQVDIHEPHEGDVNWHAHVLVTTRRFAPDGMSLDVKKARDLQPVIANGVVQNVEELQDSLLIREIQNEQFKARGMSNRVDLPHEIKHEHVGPVRMRSIFNEASKRNEERVEAEINHLNSGARVLEKVTKHMSVFTKGDLVRAVKCIPDSKARERLVEDALSSSSIVPLVTSSNGEGKIKYYTTKSIRNEEERIMRLSSYVNNLDNVLFGSDKIKSIANSLISDSKASLTSEQHTALGDVMLGSSGLKVLKGRAGTGKSHVLGRINKIASYAGVNVVGLAPTHKAKLELASTGYESTDTVKGMLFKLANSRFSLPKHSLIVVDEAGMIGNDDYRELLRVAATRKCNVILSGDDRQLSSVGRGGMFEIFANHYGSSNIYNIKRQSSKWGKSVAMAFSKGDVRGGLAELRAEERISLSEDSASSMGLLLKKWSSSNYGAKDRLILAVKNKDVAALNGGARQYLKLEGKLKGMEYKVGANRYMRGDRVLITKTNKELGLVNGDLAEISYASRDKFTLTLCGSNSQEGEEQRHVSFDPSCYSGFRHGYATTVFKAQGASIKDVYVFHDGFSGLRNSYVALSRHIDELELFANKSSCSNFDLLSRQLSSDFDSGSSLKYMSLAEYQDSKGEEEARANLKGVDKIIVHAYDFFQKNINKLVDKYIPSSEYYNYQEPKQKYERVEEVIDKTYSELEQEQVAIMEEKMVACGNNHIISHQNISMPDRNGKGVNANTNISANLALNSGLNGSNSGVNINENREISGDITRQITSGVSNDMGTSGNNYKKRESAQTRFYRNAARIRAIKQYQSQKEEWGREYEQLKSELKFKAEAITKELLGDPNQKLSNRRELRYGEHGKLAVRITGEKAGTWYDFAKGEGGDLFDLTQDVRKMSFKDAADYLKSSVGIYSSCIKPSLQIANDHANNDNLGDQIKEREAKISFANKLYDKSKYIGDKSIARSYLKDHRAITTDMSSDIRTTGIYDKESKEYLPALVVYARDKHGDITGGQHILLDKDTKAKADISVPKKSFGVISGSFADLGSISIGNNNNNNIGNNDGNQAGNQNVSNIAAKEEQTNITIIAEGLETGLSVKQALSEHSKKGDNTNNITINTLCSLGIGNIKNYAPSKGEKIIIASDNDGRDSATSKTIKEAVSALTEKGAFVEIVKPEMQGDFNDLLMQQGNAGLREIAKIFDPALTRHGASRLQKYFGTRNQSFTLSNSEKKDIDYLSQFNINEEKILNAYRTDPVKGKEELGKVINPIRFTHKHVKLNTHTIDHANIHGANINRKQLVISLLGKSEQEIDNHIWEMREKYYVKDTINDLINDRKQAKKPEKALEALQAHQAFLAKLHDTDNPSIHGKKLEQEIKIAHYNKQHNIDSQLEKLTARIAKTAMNQDKITSSLKHSTDSQNALDNLTKRYHGYVMHTIHSTIKDIKSGHRMILGDKTFTCEEKFLTHMLKEHKNNDFFPRQNVQKIYNDLTRQNEISRDFHKGMSL